MNNDNRTLFNMDVPDDLKGLANDVQMAEMRNQWSMMLPVIGVKMLIDRIAKLEAKVGKL